MAAAEEEKDPPVTTCWSVEVGKQWLGYFITCEGLGMEVVLEQREEGGNNSFVWQLPTRVKYSNIKLSRPVCDSTKQVISWLAGIVREVHAQTATIKALTADNRTVAEWSLYGVIPVRWTGPSLNADSPKVATETIEIAHHGFAELGG